MTTGKLFTVEGIDGCGKTTVVAQLVELINKNGHEAIGLREPTYQSRAGRIVRRYLDEHTPIEGNELIDLFIEDRAYDVEHNIQPALDAGKIVIMDRYMTSNAVYEATETFPWKKILQMNRTRFPEPNAVFILRPGVETSWARIILRGTSISQYETKAELYRTQELYDEIYHNDPKGIYVLIDSQGKAHETVQDIYKHIKYHMKHTGDPNSIYYPDPTPENKIVRRANMMDFENVQQWKMENRGEE